jgi:predicted RNA-binding Zn ribbon-like protein
MEKPVNKAGSVKLIGGRVCLDFLNTADWHGSDQPVEYITNYRELLQWGGHVGVLKENELAVLEKESEDRPADAARIHKTALTLREALLRIFYALIREEIPSQSDLEIFNSALSRTMKHLHLSLQSGSFSLAWKEKGVQLDKVLWPVVKDAAELLTSDLLPRVSRCGDEKCGWIYLDTSRNRSRRWCDMKDCGNRAKVKRHYHKLKK